MALNTPVLVLAQVSDSGASSSVWSLFKDSFDVFSIVLLIGSLGAVTLIVRIALDARRSVISPDEPVDAIGGALARSGADDAARTAREHAGIVGDAFAAAHAARGGSAEKREAAELAASAACGRWTRPLDLLRVIGELGPLVGLAGTVWGMILAFVRLGQAGGAAGPTDLSLGISKALFHTLLGLMLAIPCLLVHGWFRGVIDRWCNDAFARAGSLVDELTQGDDDR